MLLRGRDDGPRVALHQLLQFSIVSLGEELRVEALYQLLVVGGQHRGLRFGLWRVRQRGGRRGSSRGGERGDGQRG